MRHADKDINGRQQQKLREREHVKLKLHSSKGNEFGDALMQKEQKVHLLLRKYKEVDKQKNKNEAAELPQKQSEAREISNVYVELGTTPGP